MDTHELFRKDGTPAQRWQCGICLHAWPDKASADRCCRCTVCGDFERAEFLTVCEACSERIDPKLRERSTMLALATRARGRGTPHGRELLASACASRRTHI